MARLINSNPHPRVLLMFLTGAEDEAMEPVFATTRVIDSVARVDADEWDAVIARHGGNFTAAPTYELSTHLHVLAAVARVAGTATHPGDENGIEVGFSAGSRATELIVPPELDPALSRLVQDTLVPVCGQRHQQRVLGPSPAYFITVRELGFAPTDLVRPFLLTRRGEILAGEIRRPGGAIAWILPHDVDLTAEWAHAAMRRWREVDPARFPLGSEWRDDARWQTGGERDLHAQIASARETLFAATKRLEGEITVLDAQLRAAAAQADANERRLVTEAGAELVDAVRTALESIGFKVQDVDKDRPPGDRLEDLRVVDPDDGWTAIAEVRGYTGGARVNDLIRIGMRFATRFEKAEQTPPDRLWYIANDFREMPPGERPAILAANPVELETFGENGGLAISTVVLLELSLALAAGRIEPSAARRLLRDATGRFTLPPGLSADA
jgi:hypothetical protein